MAFEPIMTAMSDISFEEHPDGLITLYVDGVESSAIDPSDPAHLEFEYMQQIRIAIDAIFPPGPLRVLHLGAAGCALANALEAGRPNSRQLAIELDPELATLVREWFKLPTSPRLRIRSEDARVTLETSKARWDVVVRDAFRNGRVPDQLATAEAAASAARICPSGLYALNVAGEKGLAPVYREVSALKESFAYLGAISDPAILRGKRNGNVILLASNGPLPLDEIDRMVRRLPLPTIVVGMDRLLEGALGFPARHDEVPFDSVPDAGAAASSAGVEASF